MNSSTSGSQALAVDYRLTAEERKQGHLYLNQTQNGMAGAIKGLSDAQWRFKTAEDRWSIAEIVEHTIFVLERVGGPMQGALTQASAPPADRDVRYLDAIVIHQFPTRLAKFQSPEVAHPCGRFGSLSEALDFLTQSYARLGECLEHTPHLREHALPAPPMKAVTNGAHEVMDGYQWILAAAAHTDRHTKQILEVKANESFPTD